MNKPIFDVSAVAIVTPFTSEGGVNFKKLEQLVDFHLQNGTDAIVVCGSTGEASTMPDDEHIDTIKCVVDAVNHRVPVIAGTGSNDTAHGARLTKRACEVGVDATLIVTPYYNKCTPEGLYRHFKVMAESSDAPVILYNVPSRTNVISVRYLRLSIFAATDLTFIPVKMHWSYHCFRLAVRVLSRLLLISFLLRCLRWFMRTRTEILRRLLTSRSRLSLL